jgi:hypothetical protein
VGFNASDTRVAIGIGGGMAVALGYAQPSEVSADGIAWTVSDLFGFYGDYGGVVWTGTQWVAVGNGHAATSADGETWTDATPAPFSGTRARA